MRIPPPRPHLNPAAARAVTVVDISDPTAAGETIDILEQDVVQLDSAPLRARRVVIRLDSTALLYHSTNRPVRARTVLPRGVVAFVAFGPQSSGTVNGLPVGPDRLLAGASGIVMELVVRAEYQSVSILVRRDHFQAHLRRRGRTGHPVIPRDFALLQASHGAGSRLFKWAQRLAETAARYPDLFERPETRAITEHDLLEALLSSFGSAVTPEPAPHDRAQIAHSRIVRRVEELVLSRPAEHLHVGDLREAAGVSERTLQYAFNEILHMTPVAYLTRLRLHRVRQALRAATPRSTTITYEAMKWGFWHFGDFSRAYKRCFGELPSQTLRRKADVSSRPDTSDAISR